MLSVAEAGKRVCDAVMTFPAEDCPLINAHGRVLRQTLAADRDLPPFDRAAIDGYALQFNAWKMGRRRFHLVGVQAPGTIPLSLPREDACIEVMTGAVLPGGADVIVPYEEGVIKKGFVEIGCLENLTEGQAIHRQGSAYRAGAIIVQPGVRLSGREIAVAAACGYAHLAVTMQPKIAVVTTGDELVEVSSPVAPHQIRRSNDFALRAALVAAGQPRVERYHLHDMRHEIEHLLWHIVAEYEAVLITAGVSKEKFDFLPRVLDEIGVKKLVQNVAQRPGKSFWFGLSPRHTPIFFLPGNPPSAHICLHRYVLPALTKMEGLTLVESRSALLAETVKLTHEVADFLPVRIKPGPNGEPIAQPMPFNTSCDFAGLTATDGFVELPCGHGELPAGTAVRFWPWV
jgi:Molybdopterin biosynthesis enzyme